MNSSSFSVLKDDRSFRRVYSKGRSFVGFCVIVYVYKSFGKGVRFGITASKKVGNAVKRNRARRVIKSAFLEILNQQSLRGVDVVLVARGKTPFVKSFVVKRCLIKLLSGAGFSVCC